MLIGSWSQVNKFPCAQYPIIISYNSIVVRPPYKKTEDLIVPFGLRKIFLPKKRFVSLHSQKNYAARSIIYIRPMVILFLGAKRFFVRDAIPFFCKQPAVSLWLSADSELDIRRMEACLQAANGQLRSSTQGTRSGRRLRVFGYNKFQRSCRKVISLFYTHVRNTRKHDEVNFSVVWQSLLRHCRCTGDRTYSTRKLAIRPLPPPWHCVCSFRDLTAHRPWRKVRYCANPE